MCQFWTSCHSSLYIFHLRKIKVTELQINLSTNGRITSSLREKRVKLPWRRYTWGLKQNCRERNFLRTILRINEHTLTSNGIFNRCSENVWITENLQHTRSTNNWYSINVWYEILNTCLIDPYSISHNTLYAEGNRYFLEFTLPDLPRDVPPETRNCLKYYQLHRAPARNARTITRYLISIYGGKWFGIRIALPPRSRD